MNIDKIISIVKTLREEAMVAPTNNVGGGQIAGTREAGDDPVSYTHLTLPTTPYV